MSEDPAWLVLGAGVGVVVIGFGFGVVVIGFIGVGLLFGCGQAACGFISFGQVGIGVALFGGQAGGAYTGFGQGIFGIHTWSQGNSSGRDFILALAADIRPHLRFRGDPVGSIPRERDDEGRTGKHRKKRRKKKRRRKR